MNEVTACKYCLAAGECTGLCSDAAELAAKSYDAGYEKGKAEAISDYEKRLRDEFAKQALHGLLTARNRYVAEVALGDIAYSIADSMLEARKEC